MDTIIVTVTDKKSSFFQDLEVPTDLTVDKLRDDIVQTLNGYRPELYLDSFSTKIFSGRLGRQLADTETLGEVGVWNGDYLMLF